MRCDPSVGSLNDSTLRLSANVARPIAEMEGQPPGDPVGRRVKDDVMASEFVDEVRDCDLILGTGGGKRMPRRESASVRALGASPHEATSAALAATSSHRSRSNGMALMIAQTHGGRIGFRIAGGRVVDDSRNRDVEPRN